MQQAASTQSCSFAPVWERLKDNRTGREEPDAALAAFRLYRDLSPASRSLNAVALALYRQTESQAEEAPGNVVRQVERWSAQWEWFLRAGRWDDEQDRLRREDRSERLKTAVAQQRQDCQFASHLVLTLARKVLVHAQSDPEMKSVSDQQLARDVQRVLRALPELQEMERVLLTVRPRQEVESDVASNIVEWVWGGKSVKPEVVFESEDEERESSEEGQSRKEQDREEQDREEQEEQGVGAGREAPKWRDQLWVRQVDLDTGKPEPPRAFHAFVLFRDLPPGRRTLRHLTAQLRGMPETTGSGRSPARTRRRERVSATVERWSAEWQWKKRAQAWDDEQDRVRRRAERAEVERIRQEHGQQLQIARQAIRTLMGALAKRIRGAFFAGEDAKMVRCASEAIPLLARLQAAERLLYEDGIDYEERQTRELSTTGIFCWAELNCECGHPHSQHDQLHPNPQLLPCTSEGCACQKFLVPDPAEQEAKLVDSGLGLPSHLEMASS